MKKLWLFVVGMLFSVSMQASEIKDPTKNIEYFVLVNGMQVYLLSDDKAEKTRVRLTVAVGYDDETDETYGLTHLVEHLVFRDHRVPHFDYLDYIKDEGGTGVNGYTKRYETGYVATIESNKSMWLVETFAQMLFNKDVNDKDLRIEKKALQTEIGEFHWYYKPMYAFKHFVDFIVPPEDDFYLQEFAMAKEKELPDRYHAQENNRNFTLKQVMDRYKTYYYPANMKLVVVGKFDTASMRKTIQESFGIYRQKGIQSIHEPKYRGKLNGKPSLRFYEGVPDNYAYIGTKYILDAYKKYLILDIYAINLAERLQQKMRNQSGKTYSVNDYSFAKGNAGVATVSFDGLQESFSDNIVTAESLMVSDSKGLDEDVIKKTLALYEKKNYLSVEHDSDTLMGLVETREYLREEYNMTKQSAYDVFQSITVKDFNELLSKVLVPENRYKYITRDYYFFPAEMFVLNILMMLLFILLYILFIKYDLKQKGLIYTHRDIVLQRRISSRFMGFLLILFTSIMASLIQEWSFYLVSKWITGDPFYLRTIDVPQSYIATALSPLVYMLFFFIIYRTLWHYWARINVLNDKIVILGNRVMGIPKEQIEQLSVVLPKERKGGKTLGIMFRFWKPLLKMELKDGKHYYIRTSNAQHLKEDLYKWLKI